ncbi:acyl-CoA dehydrogenase C-terminal domain-containing protein [Aliamphritea hakodatensis]|uniref:acyl-CoA dehydrogenase C-terminal domain-containing protein n=1 Tax=Aliamphritea hakodatensis TaxID=2895352 RepID=UPI0022FD9EA4|nr:acyl-CoA dehydrogenase C-terminal domain-containing protein [Aliamphritea hakodatensis]
MLTYTPPIRDMQFVLYELLDGLQLSQLAGYEEVNRELIDSILEEAGRLTGEVLQPLNHSGDEQGCRFNNGQVTTPEGFKAAYRQFCESGWAALACEPEFGGSGLPKTINTLLEEMICSANLSFGIYPGLSFGAYSAISRYASDDLKQTYLPKLADGSWSGTMCLTEPQCGTDLGLCRTKAIPQQDGSYRLTGTKIFISAGDHDLTDNIVHLVLARTPDAPEGIKGISLFLVPKKCPDGGSLTDNQVSCGGIEHKMGIKASSTCQINFDDATGWLIGDLHKGMRAMFTMMNQARLAVGIQGLGLAEASYQGARNYARERLQGRALSGVKAPDKPADPIIVHPDVRRMLLTQKAYTEGCRALGLWVAIQLDISRKHGDKTVRQDADEFVQLTTPVVKALFTDLGFDCTNIGMQVLGGHGFIRENGMEQLVRDARIAQIYEGTNGIQALDLIGRKMPQKAGRYLRHFFHPVQAYLEQHQSNKTLAEFTGPLSKAFGRLQKASQHIALTGLKNPEAAAAVASDYLRLFGLVALGYMWCRMAETALQHPDDDSGFYSAKLHTARFFIQKLLPQNSSLFASIMAGESSIMQLDSEHF